MAKIYTVFIVERIEESTDRVTVTPQYRYPRFNNPKDTITMSLQMTATQQCLISVAFTDKKGNPAKVDGYPVWLTDNTELLALSPANDGMSCLIAAVGPLGSGTVSVRADADLGAGVTNISGSLDVTITGGMATGVALSAGTPVEQPTP